MSVETEEHRVDESNNQPNWYFQIFLLIGFSLGCTLIAYRMNSDALIEERIISGDLSEEPITLYIVGIIIVVISFLGLIFMKSSR